MGIPFWLTKLLIRTRLAGFFSRARRLTDGGTPYLRYYSDRVLTAPIEDLLDSAYVPDFAGPDVIDFNQPSFRAESSVNLGRLATDRWGTTSFRGLPELREAIAVRYRCDGGPALDPGTEILVAHGATGAYTAALDALVNPGDRVVLFDPCSPLFALGAKSRSAEIRWVKTSMEDGRCRFQRPEFEKAMRGAKLLVLANPGNPTGGCFQQEDLEYIAWIASSYDVLIFADESLARFQDGERVKSMRALTIAERRILTAGSVTQEFGLGALRVGWLAGPRHLIRACGLMANLHAPFVPAMCQQAALRALTQPEAGFGAILDRLQVKRDYAMDRLKAMGLAAERPGGGYFLWVQVSALGMDGRVFAERLFREHQVQVGPGCAFGPGGTGHVRLSLAGDDGRLREGLTRMAAFIQSLNKPSATPLLQEETPTEEVAEGEQKEMPKPAFSRV